MKFIDIFIRRPVLSLSISFMIIVVGVGSFFSLQIRQYPYMDSATITVTTNYPGANPATIQAFITRPIEAAVGSSNRISISLPETLHVDKDVAMYVNSASVTNTFLPVGTHIGTGTITPVGSNA